MQTMALGPCEVHVAAQSTMKILQGILCHLYLPLRHKDVRVKTLGKVLFVHGFQPGCLALKLVYELLESVDLQPPLQLSL